MKYEYKTISLHNADLIEETICKAGEAGLRLKELVPSSQTKENKYILVFERCVESETAEAILYKRLCDAHAETCNALEAMVEERDYYKAKCILNLAGEVTEADKDWADRVLARREAEDEHADTLADSREANQ